MNIKLKIRILAFKNDEVNYPNVDIWKYKHFTVPETFDIGSVWPQSNCSGSCNSR